MDSKDLEKRIQSIEDLEAIKKLKHQYCHYCDDNYAADGIAALYTEDAIWEGGGIGSSKGAKPFGHSLKALPNLSILRFITL